MATSSVPLTKESFDQFYTRLQASAVKATRNAALLPTDVDFYRSMDANFSREIDALSSRVLTLTNRILSLVETADPGGKGKQKAESQDDVVDNFHSLFVDPMDQLLERTDTSLDVYQGKSKVSAIVVTDAITPTAARKPQKQSSTAAPRGQLDPALQHAHRLPKPQLSFLTKVDNSDTPWYPTLPHKYNARVPLGHHFQIGHTQTSDTTILHPYLYEITHLTYPSRLFQSMSPIPVKSFAETPFHWVTARPEFDAMLAKLRMASEIAVDLEHHSYRTFAGFLCLLQISTREEDWVVDLLVLRNEMSELNEIFTDPKIVKVFHGAESDIVWLQQDFQVYVVNLFDTYHASKVLDFPRHGLAHLLEMYCDFIPDKRFQLADWRIRPLPQEMLEYARSDTHFLLFIYDNLRNALLDLAQSRSRSQSPSAVLGSSAPTGDPAHRLVRQVLSRSEETALRLYQRETYEPSGSGPGGWDSLARKWNKPLLAAGPDLHSTAGMQKEVYKAVHSWRDRVAREEDESTRYILSNHYLFQLAEQPPADLASILRTLSSAPATTKRRAKELLEVIRDAVKTQLTPAPPLPSVPEPEPQGIVLVPHGTPSVTVGQPHLWSQAELPSSMVASTTSLFGTVAMPNSTTWGHSPRVSATSSSLFGPTKPVSLLDPSQSRFHEVVARIHSTLGVALPTPKVTISQVPSIGDQPPIMNDVITGMQVEIPFVPAAQRQPKPIIDDAVIVVGQAKQKKRKRVRDAEGVASGSSSSRRTKDDTPVEPFDFSTVPNILDADTEVEATHVQKKGKKDKKQAKGGSFHGDFPAPPRALNSVKGGNQSHTFKP